MDDVHQLIDEFSAKSSGECLFSENDLQTLDNYFKYIQDQVIPHENDISPMRLVDPVQFRREDITESIDANMRDYVIGEEGSDGNNLIRKSFGLIKKVDEVMLAVYGSSNFRILSLIDFATDIFLVFEDELTKDGAEENPELFYNKFFTIFASLSNNDKGDILSRLINDRKECEFLEDVFDVPVKFTIESLENVFKANNPDFDVEKFKSHVNNLRKTWKKVMERVKDINKFW